MLIFFVFMLCLCHCMVSREKKETIFQGKVEIAVVKTCLNQVKLHYLIIILYLELDKILF